MDNFSRYFQWFRPDYLRHSSHYAYAMYLVEDNRGEYIVNTWVTQDKWQTLIHSAEKQRAG